MIATTPQPTGKALRPWNVKPGMIVRVENMDTWTTRYGYYRVERVDASRNPFSGERVWRFYGDLIAGDDMLRSQYGPNRNGFSRYYSDERVEIYA